MSGAKARRVVAVRIAGHEYKIRSEADEDGLIRIAGYVDRAMQRVRERTGTVDTLDVAVLTCLNLAREILALHEERGGAVGDEKLRSLIDRVESVLGAHGSKARADAAAATGTGSPEERPRTLDLPGVEDLRDHMPVQSGTASDPAKRSIDPEVPVRVAAGGRDRVA